MCDLNPWLRVTVREDDPRARNQAPREFHPGVVVSGDARICRGPRVLPAEGPARAQAAAAVAGASVRLPTLCRFLADCGPRIGEVFAMKRSGLMLGTGQLAVRSPGSAWRGMIVGSSDEKDHDRLLPVPAGPPPRMLQSMPTLDRHYGAVPNPDRAGVALLELHRAGVEADARDGGDRSAAARVPSFVDDAFACCWC